MLNILKETHDIIYLVNKFTKACAGLLIFDNARLNITLDLIIFKEHKVIQVHT